MKKLKLGLIREGKIPPDNRVPLNPEQAVRVEQLFPGVKVYCQRSEIRCFPDEAYAKQGITLVDDILHCDILMGIKEVPVEQLIPQKTYLFFSHAIKKQAYNRDLLRGILEKKIKLIDYERLTDHEGNRIIAFGRFAGIVGAYNGLMTYGQRYGFFDLKRAYRCHDMEALKAELKRVSLPLVKIVLTGGGRVAYGAMEVLDFVGIEKVGPQEFLNQNFGYPVYTKLDIRDYNRPKKGGPFDRHEFFMYPERYESAFLPYTHAADMLIGAAYWDSRAPVLFTREDMMDNRFRIKIIADITCDIEGSIPSTKRPAIIEEPVYDYDPWLDMEEAPFSGERFTTVMAVDNLPSELPRDASTSFGENLITHVFPHLFGNDPENVIKRATVTKNGKLTGDYAYLQDFVDGKE